MIASMFGPVLTIAPARKKPATAIATTPSTPASTSPKTAERKAPICNEVRRPIVASARCPHSGFSTMRATAIAAITSPMSLSVRPLPSR